MLIHVAFPSGEKRELEESQLRSQWEQGGIPADSMYWKEGMADWLPIANYLSPYAPPQVSPIPPSVERSGQYSYTVDPRVLTKTLVVFLGIYIAFDVVVLISTVFQFTLLTGGPFSIAEGEANDRRQMIVGVSTFIWFFVTGIAFLKWIRRANINCAGFGAWNMEFTPGWSIGWYFIPVASLFKPFQAMREIWKISHDPENWQNLPTGGLVKVWWTFWILNNLGGQISTRIAKSAEDMDALVTSTVVGMVASGISIALTGVAIKLVKRIASRQEELVGEQI